MDISTNYRQVGCRFCDAGVISCVFLIIYLMIGLNDRHIVGTGVSHEIDFKWTMVCWLFLVVIADCINRHLVVTTWIIA